MVSPKLSHPKAPPGGPIFRPLKAHVGHGWCFRLGHIKFPKYLIVAQTQWFLGRWHRRRGGLRPREPQRLPGHRPVGAVTAPSLFLCPSDRPLPRPVAAAPNPRRPPYVYLRSSSCFSFAVYPPHNGILIPFLILMPNPDSLLEQRHEYSPKYFT